MKAIKEMKNLFFFDDLQNLKLIDISTVTLRRFKKKITAGDAYWLTGNEISKVKIVKRKG
jgi:S-DNA-T family DNA segregation ATPase FtsK/SpoIIIE